MNDQLDDFLVYLGSEKGLTQNTIEAYQRDTFAFLKFLEAKGVRSFRDVEKEQIIDFLAFLKSQGLAVSTISRHLISIKVLFRFLKREREIEHNITLYLQSPKLWQIIPEVLTLEEMESLLNQPDLETPKGVRDKAILELLYACGLRVSELCQLKINGVDEDSVRVFGKGRKERIVPLGSQASKAIDQYLLEHRDQYRSDEEGFLFVNNRGKPMDRVSIWRMIKAYGKQAGLTKNLSPHTMRHSFATHLLDNGAELRVIQEMLGHASISSTDRYTHVSRSHLQNAFDRYHPASSGSSAL